MKDLSEQAIGRFLRVLEKHELNLHSVLIWHKGEIRYEAYRPPYTAAVPHRMYSVTKSFVSAAVGALSDEGKIGLDDPIISYFPDKLPKKVSRELKEQTIRHMLSMQTCFPEIGNWFLPEVRDRTVYYFSRTPVRPAGTLFYYDSNAAQVLCALVERLSGKPLLNYLREKVLDRLGEFESAEMLLTPDGTSWGDSGLLCTPRALLRFAQFVMQKGAWNGEQLISRAYLEQAVSRQAETCMTATDQYEDSGYGYQIWMTERNGFAFFGAGGQAAICIPEQELILVTTGDLQNDSLRLNDLLYRAFFSELVDPFYEERAEPPLFSDSLWMTAARGKPWSLLAEKIDGAVFDCLPNEMGISRFSLHFSDRICSFRYENGQGEKELLFGMKQNVSGFFPQLGCSDTYGNVHEINSFRYRCEASAGWLSDRCLEILVRITDRYHGILVITVGFNGEDKVGIRMMKFMEDNLNEYQGMLGAYRAPSSVRPGEKEGKE